ncbi:hypothetical protein ACSIGC_15080 [Tenacibaculum sp. ZS6-P6]|uniref:hypothetical protein n=1 Tax=Tenacibaculum sp. ZS6-P6 TaxID=3447503 RepID=UPI003F9E30A8
MKQIIIVSLFAFISINAQRTTHQKKYRYYNADFKEISFLNFKQNEDSELFKTVNYENDSSFIRKLMYKEVFGKLDKRRHHQLKKLYSLRYKIDTTKAWFIHYVDSIPNKEKMPAQSGIAYYNKQKEVIGFVPYGSDSKTPKKDYSNAAYHAHLSSYNDYVHHIEKEISSFGKEKTSELIHFYNKNHGFPKNVLYNLSYFKDDNLILKKSFREAVRNYEVIVIHPDGQFYLSFFGNRNYISFSGRKNITKKLLKKSFFNRKRKQWKRKVKQLQ